MLKPLTKVTCNDKINIVKNEKVRGNMKIKRFIAVILTALTVAAVMAVPVSADFEKDGGKTYYTEDGVKVTGFKVIDGSTYYFKKSDGSMAMGWMKISDKYYYFSKSSGKMLASNTYRIDGKVYTFGDDGVWNGKSGTASSSSSSTTTTTTAKASTGYKDGVWGEKLSATKKRVGGGWYTILEGEQLSVGMNMETGWTKYGDSKMIGSFDMYIYNENALIAGATMYMGSSPVKNGKPTEEIPTTELTKAQIDALAKALKAKGEKVGEEVDESYFEGMDLSGYDGFKMYMGSNSLAAVLWNYDDKLIMYMEMSVEELAEYVGIDIEDVLAELL
jgi:hypothetical protein